MTADEFGVWSEPEAGYGNVPASSNESATR